MGDNISTALLEALFIFCLVIVPILIIGFCVLYFEEIFPFYNKHLEKYLEKYLRKYLEKYLWLETFFDVSFGILGTIIFSAFIIGILLGLFGIIITKIILGSDIKESEISFTIYPLICWYIVIFGITIIFSLNIYEKKTRHKKILKRLQKLNKSYWKVDEIFEQYDYGLITKGDKLKFIKVFWLDYLFRKIYWSLRGVCDGKIVSSQEKNLKDDLNTTGIMKILYKPFDTRYIKLMDNRKRLRNTQKQDLIHHMSFDNIGILMRKQQKIKDSKLFDHIFIARDREFLVTDKITDAYIISNRTLKRTYLFPLYLYPTQSKEYNPNSIEKYKRLYNIKAEIFLKLKKIYNKEVTGEEIFFYICAILNNLSYLKIFRSISRRDYPTIFFTKDYGTFINLGKIGKEFTELYLLNFKEFDTCHMKLQGLGDNKIKRIKWETKFDYDGVYLDRFRYPMYGGVRKVKDKLYINQTQYFNNSDGFFWKAKICGHKVFYEWLRDHKGDILSLDEINTYCNIPAFFLKLMNLEVKIDQYKYKLEDDFEDFFDFKIYGKKSNDKTKNINSENSEKINEDNNKT